MAEISPRLAGLSAKEAKDEMRVWAQDNIRGMYRNADTGWDIRISLTGISESTGRRAPRHNQMEILAAVPDLLQSMVRYESEPDKEKRRGVRAFHHFAGAVKLDDELMRVRLTVKEVADGRLFYDHCLLEKAGSGVTSYEDPERTQNTITGPAEPTITVAEFFDGVKYRDGKFVLESVGERIVTDLDAADDDVQYRKAEAGPSKDAFLGALRKVVADHVSDRDEKAAAAPQQPSPAPGEGTPAEPADREAEAAARVFAELQTDWKAHVAAAQRRLGGHPFYHGPWSGRYSPNGQGASG